MRPFRQSHSKGLVGLSDDLRILIKGYRQAMPVRKTETRIPLQSAASDLGEASVAADGRCALVSFITSPLVVNRENTYVVFVTDAGLATQAATFEWSFSENGGTASTQSTQVGEAKFIRRRTPEVSASPCESWIRQTRSRLTSRSLNPWFLFTQVLKR